MPSQSSCRPGVPPRPSWCPRPPRSAWHRWPRRCAARRWRNACPPGPLRSPSRGTSVPAGSGTLWKAVPVVPDRGWGLSDGDRRGECELARRLHPDIGRETLGDAGLGSGFAYAAAGNVPVDHLGRPRPDAARRVAGSRGLALPDARHGDGGRRCRRACAPCWTAGHPGPRAARARCARSANVAAVLAAAVATRGRVRGERPCPDWRVGPSRRCSTGPRATDGEHRRWEGSRSGLIVDLVTRPGPPPAWLPERRVVPPGHPPAHRWAVGRACPGNEIGDALRHPAVPCPA